MLTTLATKYQLSNTVVYGGIIGNGRFFEVATFFPTPGLLTIVAADNAGDFLLMSQLLGLSGCIYANTYSIP